MTPVDIVLVNMVSYMGGIFTGMAFCFRYKNSLIARSRSQDRFVRNPVDVTHHMHAQPTQPSAPVFPVQGYPPASPPKREIVIRDTE